MGRGAERRGVGRRTRRMPGGGRKKARQAKSLSGQRNKKGLFSSPNLVPPNKNARRDTAGISVWWKIGDSPAAYPTVRRTVGCALRCAGPFSSPNLVPPNKNARRDTAGISVWWKIGDSPAAYPTVRRTVGCALRCAGLFSSPNLVPPNKNTRRDTAGVSVWWKIGDSNPRPLRCERSALTS